MPKPLNYHFQHFDMFSGVGEWEIKRNTLRSQKKEKEKPAKDYQLFSLFSEFHDKSGESDKNRESGRQHDK